MDTSLVDTTFYSNLGGGISIRQRKIFRPTPGDVSRSRRCLSDSLLLDSLFSVSPCLRGEMLGFDFPLSAMSRDDGAVGDELRIV
jgi:hypothetical protein